MESYVFPGNIDEQIMKIGSQPFIYMRTDAFSEVNKESERLLLELIHCRGGRTVIYTGSGTGAMAAVVENYVTTKQKAFVIDGGSFGHRWYQMCQYYGIAAVDYRVPFACDIDYDDLESQIARERPDVFLCQHHETSTGQLYDLACISRICHKYGVSMVVDVISTFLADELDIPVDKISDTLKVSGRHISVDAPFVEGEDNSLLDVLVNDDSPMADRTLVNESLSREIDRALDTLTEREKAIIQMFFGIGRQEMTLEEIGDEFNLTRERVRQIKEKAIRRLRSNSKNKLLKSYLG